MGSTPDSFHQHVLESHPLIEDALQGGTALELSESNGSTVRVLGACFH